MKGVANCRFSIKSWDEKPYSEGQDLPRLTRASVTRTFTGEGHVEYLMMYRGDGSASFAGSRVRHRTLGWGCIISVMLPDPLIPSITSSQ